MGGTVYMALGFGRRGLREGGERGRREREARERQEVTSPLRSTRPYTWLYWGASSSAKSLVECTPTGRLPGCESFHLKS